MDDLGQEKAFFAARRLRDSAESCLLLFDKVARTSYNVQAQKRSLATQHSKFKIWCGNLGVRQGGHASLDWRLKDAEEIEVQVYNLLQDLLEDLAQCLEVFSGQRPPLEDQHDEVLDDQDFQASSSQDEDGGGEVDIRCSAIVTTINNLYRIAFLIRNPASRQLALERGQTYTPRDPDTGEDTLALLRPFDRQHVNDMFHELRRIPVFEDDEENESAFAREAHRKDERERGSEIDEVLKERLTDATSARRRQFAYWEMHSRKLQSADPKESTETEQLEDGMERMDLSVRPETIYSDTQASGVYRSSRAESYVETRSQISTTSTARDLSNEEAQFPRPPKGESEDEPFVCPLCYVLCPPQDRHGSRWRTHILEDLRPYVCTYPDCITGNRMYGIRDEWLAHERSMHRKVWKCPTHPGEIFLNKLDFDIHLTHFHKDLDVEQTTELTMSSASTRDDDREQCPVCLTKVDDLPERHTLASHLANHAERFSLDALPLAFDNEPRSEESGLDDVNPNREAPGSLDRELSREPPDAASAKVTFIPYTDRSSWNTQKTQKTNPSSSFTLLPLFTFKLDSDLQLGSVFKISSQTGRPALYDPTAVLAPTHKIITEYGPLRYSSTDREPSITIPRSMLRFRSARTTANKAATPHLSISSESSEVHQTVDIMKSLQITDQHFWISKALDTRLGPPVYVVTALIVVRNTQVTRSTTDPANSDPYSRPAPTELYSVEPPLASDPTLERRRSGTVFACKEPFILAYQLSSLQRKLSGKLVAKVETKWADM